MASTSIDNIERGAPADGGAVHPHYVQFAPVWTKLRHAFDGTGGFADGTYLAAHPREWVDYRIPETFEVDATGASTGVVKKWRSNPTPTVPTAKLKARRAIARYENLAGPIIEQKLSALFRQGPTRLLLSGAEDKEREKLKDHPFKQFEEDCDGYGTPLTEFMKEADRLAQVIGFSILVMDRAAGPVPKSMAEQKLPVLRLYSPLDAPDWVLDANGQLSQIALLEAVPRASLSDSADAADYRRRILTETHWQTITPGKTAAAVTRQGKHGFGRLPVVTLYAKRPALIPWIGQSVLGDPKLLIDLFNLTSELRELLRNQTFSILNVTLGTGETAQSVHEAQNMMGSNVGTDNVLFTAAGAGFISPDAANVKAYQDEREDLIRTIYRMSNTPFEADSRDAEAEGSLQLKREDFNQGLSSLADECEKAEYQIAELFFRAHYGVNWEREYETADLSIAYPRDFDPTPFDDLLSQAQALIAIGMPHEVMKAIRKQIVPQALPGATAAQLNTLIDAIDKMEDPAEVAQKNQEALIKARFEDGETDDEDESDDPTQTE
jgi:hypothetical protein